MNSLNIGVGKGEYLQLPLLTATQCTSMLRRIHELEQHWHRSAMGTSLGLAWYKMLEDGMMHVYHAQAAQENALLLDHFMDFDQAVHALGKLLQGPDGQVGYPVRPRVFNLGPYWSLFGFTISDQVSKDADDQGYQIVHRDYEGLSPYPAKLFDDDTRAYSAVISLATPATGGGLKIFPERFLGNAFSAPSMAEGANADLAYQELIEGRRLDPVLLNYTPGVATVFDSFLPHAIQEMTLSPEHPERVVGVVHYLFIEETDNRPAHFEYWF